VDDLLQLKLAKHSMICDTLPFCKYQKNSILMCNPTYLVAYASTCLLHGI